MMKRKTSPLLLALALLLLNQIQTKAQSNRKFTIKGVIDTVPRATYFVNYLNKGIRMRDTISLDNERRFIYTGKISEPTIFNMTIKNTINPLFIGDTHVYSFWVEPGKTISLAGKTGWLVKGIKGLVAVPKKFQLENSKIEIVESNYRKSRIEATDVWKKNTGQPINDAISKRISDSVKIDFIHRNPGNYYSLYLLNSDLKTYKPNYAATEKLLDKLSKELRNTYLGKESIQRIAIDKKMGIGKVMPDFEQTDTLSRNVKLSSLRGKYVLVDFWASWCGPCRNEHPYLVEAYKQFAAQGFEILGISLDNSKADWQEAIRQDKLFWTNVSDLKGKDNAVAKSFYIQSVPDNFLLDPNGVIIAKQLNGKQLLQKLKEIF